MAFTINPNLPPQVWAVGQAVTIQLGMEADSTPAPTGWTATGLPTGLSISSAGKITGTAEAPGLYDVVATATGSGPVTDELAFQIGISDGGRGVIPAGAVVVLFDLDSGAVTVPGVTPGATGAKLFAKRGDTIQFALAAVHAEIPAELDMISVDAALKRFEPEAILAESDGVFYPVGEGGGRFYVLDLPLPAAGLNAALSDEEDDAGTLADFLFEFALAWNYWPPGTDPEDPEAEPRVIRRKCQTVKFRVERGWLT